MPGPKKNNLLRERIHALNNHFAVIRLYAQLGLQYTELPDEQKEGYEAILGELDGIKKVSHDFDRFRMLLSNLPGMVYKCLNEPGWPMEFISEGCLPLTGYEPSEIIKGSKLQYEYLIHPKDRKMVFDKVQERIEKGEPFILEYRIITKDGTEKWVWERGQEIRASKNKDKWLEGFIMDITDRKKAQQSLKESEEKYSIAFQTSPYAMIISRLSDGYIMDVNKSFEEMSGFQRSEIIGDTTIGIKIWVRSEDREAVVSDLRNNIPIRNREYQFWSKNNDISIGELSIEIITINDEPYILSSYYDITERRKTEDELKDTQEKLLSIFRVAPSGIGMVKDRLIMEVNDRVCEMSGYKAKELIGKSSRVLYPSQEEFDFVGKEKYEQIEKRGTGIVETRWQKKDGTVINVMLASTPLIPGDNSRGVIFTALDITDRKRAEEEQKMLEEHIRQVQKMETIGRLAGGVAHEFNNALQIINTYTELSMMKLDREDPIYQYMEQIISTTKQSSGMISQLLAFARKQAVSPELLDLNKLVEGMAQMLEKLTGDDIHVVWEPGKDIWQIMMDPAQINQVLLNLVLNARDAIPKKGTILIRTENESCSDHCTIDHEEHVPGDYVMLSVTDDGSGMDKKTMEKIFEPFFTTKDKMKGTGLGLSTVYGIVKQNKGFIIVDSKKGKGSTFKVYIPRY